MGLYQCQLLDDEKQRIVKENIYASSLEEARANVVYNWASYRLMHMCEKKTPWWWVFFINKEHLSLWARHIHLLLMHGVPLVKALSITRNDISAGPFRIIQEELLNALQKGHPLSLLFDYYKTFFSHEAYLIIKTSEQVHNYQQGFQSLHNLWDFQQSLKQNIYAQVRYPFFLMMISFGVVGILKMSMLPAFIDLHHSLNQGEKPMDPFLLWMHDLSLERLIFSLIFLGGAGVLVHILSRWHKNTRLFKDRLIHAIPVIGKIIKQYYFYRFFKQLSVLIHSHIPFIDALKECAQATPHAMLTQSIQSIITYMEKGENIQSIIKKPSFSFFPTHIKLFLGMIHDGGNTGQIITMCAQYQKDLFDQSLKKCISFIHPLCILLVASLLLMMVMGIMSPLYDQLETLHGS
jgi:type II secretory pathway component PulF